MDFSFFDTYHMHLKSLFTHIGWDNFLSLNQPQYSTLVRHLYTHFTHHNFDSIASYVKGKEIQITRDLLSSIFKIPHGEVHHFETNTWIPIDGFNPLTALRQIFHDNSIESLIKPTLSELTVEHRIIHHLITHNIDHKAGSSDYLFHFENFLLWGILNGIKLDLPYYMICHMDDCVKKKKGTLPNGLHITSILQQFQIPLNGEKDICKIIPHDTYSTKTMKQIHYILQNGI